MRSASALKIWLPCEMLNPATSTEDWAAENNSRTTTLVSRVAAPGISGPLHTNSTLSAAFSEVTFASAKRYKKWAISGDLTPAAKNRLNSSARLEHSDWGR